MCYSGSVENHVKQSNGGESDIMNHYATSYKSSYGQHWEHFRSRNPSLYGSGYTANIRPVVQYSPILDDIDNKRMRQLLKSNYFSVTHSDFLPFALQSGKEKIPNLTKFKLPKKYGAQIHKIHDSMMNVGLPSITGTGKPPTFSKDHHFLLADCGDPQMQTSYGSNYTKPKTHRYDIARIAMGPKEQTGSTRNNPTEETLTGRPVSPHFGSSFRLKTDRPLGTTHYSDNYIPYNTSDGKESFSKWMGPSVNQEQTSHLKQMKLWPDRVPDQSSNVYTRPEHMSEETLEKLKKTDPAEYQNVIHGFKDPSMHKGMFTNQQVQPTPKVLRLGQRSVGPNESSGFTLNETGHVDYDAGPPDQFVTHYMTRFYPLPPGNDGSDRCGHVHFNTRPCGQTSLATEAQVRRIEPQVPATDKLISLPSFQARSIIARDQLGIQPSKGQA